MILDELYYGNIEPTEQAVPKEYRKLSKRTGDLLAELEKALSKEQMELVDKFYSHITDVHCMEVKAKFQYGFSLGVTLMKEVQDMLSDDND